MKTRDLIKEFLNKKFYLSASNLRSIENKLINYNTVLGQWFDNTLLINTTHYSITTSKHQNNLIEFANQKGIHYYPL